MTGRILLSWVVVALTLSALWMFVCTIGAMVNRWRQRRAARAVVQEATDLTWEATARHLLRPLYDDEDHL